MPVELQLFSDGSIARHDWSDRVECVKVRQFQRRCRSSGSASIRVCHEFSFSEDEWRRLRDRNPSLFEPDPVKRGQAWRRLAESQEAGHFRVS
jgi:hypothetical protein